MSTIVSPRSRTLSPAVGMLATYSYASDSYPAVVVDVSPSGRKVTLGRIPVGDVKMREDWIASRQYTEEEVRGAFASGDVGEPIYAYASTRGYYAGSARVSFGRADYFRNHAD